MSPGTSISYFESAGSDETLVTVAISGVDALVAQDVHTVPALFMLAKDTFGAAVKDSGFEWSGPRVFAGFVIGNAQKDRFYTNVARVAARFGVSAVSRIAL